MRKTREDMRSNQVREHVSDSVEHGIHKLHRIADRFLVYPLAAMEGAIQGAARGVHNIVMTHKHHQYHYLDQAIIDPGKCKHCKNKPPDSAYVQPVGPYGSYGYPPPPTTPTPTAPPQSQYPPSFPVPCRPPY